MGRQVLITGMTEWVSHHSLQIATALATGIVGLTGFATSTQFRLAELESKAHTNAAVEVQLQEIQRNLDIHVSESRSANRKTECMIIALSEELPLTGCVD